MTYEEFETLKKEFGEQVFPHCPPGPDRNLVDQAGWAYDADSIEFDPACQAFVQCFPGYRLTENRGVHFTSLTALHSILNEYSIRLYSLASTNDPNEFTYLASDHDDSAYRLKSTKESSYLLSMCAVEALTSNNILDLWRFYGQAGWGVAVEFSVELWETGLSDYMMARVAYGKPDYSGYFHECELFARRYGRSWRHRSLLNLPSLLHKHEAYSSEKEVRLVRMNGENPKKDMFYYPTTGYYCDFNSRNELVNYMNLPLQTSELFQPVVKIDRIQFGFRHSPDFVREASEHIVKVIRQAQTDRNLPQLIPTIEQSPLRDIYR